MCRRSGVRRAGGEEAARPRPSGDRDPRVPSDAPVAGVVYTGSECNKPNIYSTAPPEGRTVLVCPHKTPATNLMLQRADVSAPAKTCRLHSTLPQINLVLVCLAMLVVVAKAPAQSMLQEDMRSVDRAAIGFLGGARDLIYDSEHSIVLVVGTGGAFSVIDVSKAQPRLISTIEPTSIKDAHGLAYDYQRRRAFVASVATASVLCIDISNPQEPKILSTLQNSTWLYYSTHLSYDPSRAALFVCSAGNGAEVPGKLSTLGHSISSVAVAGDGSMELVQRMTSWAPDSGGIPGKHFAYPVFSTLDSARRLLYVSNDARCSLEVIDVSTLAPRKISNYTDCSQIEYNSQTAYDPRTQRLFTVAQHANSFAVFDVSNPGQPKLTNLLQDRNQTSCKTGGCTKAQIFAGATGVAFDADRNLAFVASEYAKTFAVVDLGGVPVKVVGVVRHEQLSGEAIQYDNKRQRAFVVSRQASALLAVDVANMLEPNVIGVLSSKK
eukprot:COSAG02_NODE_1430_length_12650_cov_5.887260_6_plen_494_part_00